MSNFLNHLASRAVAPVPAVRPLIRTRYESQAVDEFKLSDVPPTLAIQGIKTLPTAQPKSILTPDRASEIMEALRPAQRISFAPAPIDGNPPAIVDTPVQVAAGLEPLGKNFGQPFAPTPVSEGQPPAKVPAPVRVNHIGIKGITAPVTASAESVTPRPIERIPVAANNPTAATARAEHRPSASAALPSLRPQGQTVSQIFPRPLAARPVVAAAPQPAPQVTITIGRVEIRAAAPAAQAPLPATNSSPRLSLDTYLRQRGSQSA